MLLQTSEAPGSARNGLRSQAEKQDLSGLIRDESGGLLVSYAPGTWNHRPKGTTERTCTVSDMAGLIEEPLAVPRPLLDHFRVLPLEPVGVLGAVEETLVARRYHA